jgi:hypothetical protein
MSKVFVTTTAEETQYAPYACSNYRRILRAAKFDQIKEHRLVDDPEIADLILFVGGSCKFHLDIFSSSIYRLYEQKCTVFDFSDNAIPRIPGLYMGIPKRFHSIPVYKYGFYIRVFDNQMTQSVIEAERREYLYSFVGSTSTSPQLRSKILSLPKKDSCLLDRSSGQSDGDADYVKIMAKSKFVLCPRGIGPSTWRLFETMSSGRAPVIVSDDWVPPAGPRWADFSIIVREDSVHKIPAILRGVEPQAESMGAIAREEWNKHFAQSTAFNWIVTSLVSINQDRTKWKQVIDRNSALEIVTSGNLAKYLKSWIRRF